MRITKALAPDLQKKLQVIVDTYGAQTDFIKRSKISRGALQNLALTGRATAQILEQVTRALVGELAEVTPYSIIKATAENYGIKWEAVKTASEPRQVAAYLMDREAKLRLKDIALELGYSDHTGAQRAIKTITDRMDVERDLRNRVYTIRLQFQ